MRKPERSPRTGSLTFFMQRAPARSHAGASLLARPWLSERSEVV